MADNNNEPFESNDSHSILNKENTGEARSLNFIEEVVEKDLASGKREYLIQHS